MKIKKYIISIVTILLLSAAFIHSQERVKIATYNILNYPNNTVVKNPKFKLILDNLNPDILVVQEILSQSAVNEFLNEVLSDEFEAGTFINGPDTDNAIFFKDSLFQFISTEFIAPSQGPRYISVFKLFHKITFDTLIIYSAHFKASSGSENELRRLNEAATLRVFTDLLPQGTDFLLVGDLNLYRSTEPAYEKLLVQDGTGNFLDPIDFPGSWHESFTYRHIHTQSTRTANLPDGGSSGGLDDRFDFILSSQSIIDQGGIDYVEDSYWAYGNDGEHFNVAIIISPYPISQQMAFDLHDVSDHLPVVAEFDFGVVSGVEDEFVQPDDFILFQNYPNPFNPTTKIQYAVSNRQFISLNVYDVLGNEIAVLVNEEKPSGTYEVDFDASNLPSGVYMYRLTSGNISLSKKLILLK
ncbi:MAG: T9SS type A sorting domain-containing protein [Bacteroidetes bacterium]|nr:T9SS type A sorting domain-containing protein [Bacteroidota bacterium]